jgi:hypothetical protein
MMNTVSRNIPFPEPKLMKKYISIHSEDRDTLKYKSPSEFTIYLPDPITNVCSVRVKDVIFPKLYIFSEDYHNHKMTEVTKPNILLKSDKPIEIKEAKRYTLEELMKRIEDNLTTGTKVYYHPISNKIILTNKSTTHAFTLQLHDTEASDDIIDLKTHWGLGYYLGFDKTNEGFDYFENSDTKNAVYENKKDIKHKFNSYPLKSKIDAKDLRKLNSNNVLETGDELAVDTNILPSNRQVRLDEGRREVYMEIDGLNSMDEIDPISNKAQFYRKNSAITKIPLPPYTSEQVEIDQLFFENKTEFKTPIDKLYKCSFRFRYHDGTLIDFHGSDLSFTLEFEYLS